MWSGRATSTESITAASNTKGFMCSTAKSPCSHIVSKGENFISIHWYYNVCSWKYINLWKPVDLRFHDGEWHSFALQTSGMHRCSANMWYESSNQEFFFYCDDISLDLYRTTYIYCIPHECMIYMHVYVGYVYPGPCGGREQKQCITDKCHESTNTIYHQCKSNH